MKEGKETYKCTFCDREFVADDSIDPLPISCPYCGSKKVDVKDNESLRRTNEMLKHYKCKNCGKDIALEGEADRDVKTCPHCGSGDISHVEGNESKMAEAVACYKCYSCGLLFTMTEAPSVCAYCGGKPVMRWTTEALVNRIDKLNV